MAGSVTAALDAAGFSVISNETLDAEIALAHQAGYEEGRESVRSDG